MKFSNMLMGGAVRREVRTCAFFITGAPKSNNNSSIVGFHLFYIFMNIPRDSKGRYVRTNSQNFVKIPTNLYGGGNTPTTNSVERYRRTHVGSSSTWKP